MTQIRLFAMSIVLFSAVTDIVPARAYPIAAPGHPDCASITYENPLTPACNAVIAVTLPQFGGRQKCPINCE